MKLLNSFKLEREREEREPGGGGEGWREWVNKRPVQLFTLKHNVNVKT